MDTDNHHRDGLIIKRLMECVVGREDKFTFPLPLPYFTVFGDNPLIDINAK